MRSPRARFAGGNTPLLGLRRAGAILPVLLAASALRAQPFNDDFETRIGVSGAAGGVRGNNFDATRQPGEPDHAGNRPRASVWWVWTTPISGIATLDTAGSDFDTIMSVYTGTGLRSLTVMGENDGGPLAEDCVVIFPAKAGVQYVICVDGFEGQEGSIFVNWRVDPACAPPLAPGPPSPPSLAAGVPTTTVLRWSARAAARSPRTIYGKDDRLDIYQVADPALVDLWDSTVAVVPRGDLHRNADGTYSLPGTTFQALSGVCPTERFAEQPAPAFCSGFLVGKDLLITAGHCVPMGGDCARTAFVFGFRMLDETTPVLTFPADQVYFCKEIVAAYHPDDLADWGLIRLDREVPDHQPLPIRRTGKIADQEQVFIIGHPMGLPAKLAAGAWVRSNDATDSFITNLDAYGGNSGSAVFNGRTRVVEGIMVAGDSNELVRRGDCLVSAVCPDDGCFGGLVTRSTQFSQVVPRIATAPTYRIYLGACGGNLELLGETTETSWEVTGLASGATYCWKVTAEDDCAETGSATWRFTTEAAPRFRRGDADASGTVDLTDAVVILAALFQGGAAPTCQDAADVDDSGKLDVTDAIALLGFLFQGEGAPPAPGPSDCGPDATPSDEITAPCTYGACQ